MKLQSTSYIIERKTLDGDWRRFVGDDTEYRNEANATEAVKRYRKRYPEDEFRITIRTTVYETTEVILDEAA